MSVGGGQTGLKARAGFKPALLDDTGRVFSFHVLWRDPIGIDIQPGLWHTLAVLTGRSATRWLARRVELAGACLMWALRGLPYGASHQTVLQILHLIVVSRRVTPLARATAARHLPPLTSAAPSPIELRRVPLPTLSHCRSPFADGGLRFLHQFLGAPPH